MLMSRVIKFRFWDASADYRPCMYYWPNREGETQIFLEHWLLRDNLRMQFTGLHDKNGKEIYEGDIVEFRNIDASVLTLRLPVVWDKAACGFHCDDGKKQRGVDMASGYDTISGEIIGNIYENPDLLKP